MQVADPLTLYRQPENLFVAGFIGSPPMNLLKGKVQRHDGGLFFAESAENPLLNIPLKGRLESLATKYVDKDIIFGIRPEHLSDEVKDPAHVSVTSTVHIPFPPQLDFPTVTTLAFVKRWGDAERFAAGRCGYAPTRHSLS
jgi:multiple sugar transport system ATP-binding protein